MSGPGTRADVGFLDLRGKPADLIGQLRRPEQPFVIVADEESTLLEHTAIYEQLLDRAAVICIVAGEDGPQDDRLLPAARLDADSVDRWLRFTRPASLQPPRAAVLWAADLLGEPTASSPIGSPGSSGTAGWVAAAGPDASEDSLLTLVDLLLDREVFTQVLGVMEGVPGAVVVPAVRARSYELGADALMRAQRQVLQEVAGRNDQRDGEPPPRPELRRPLDRLVIQQTPAGSGTGEWWQEDGEARSAHGGCVEVFDAAADALSATATPAVLLRRSTTSALPGLLDAGSQALEHYRSTVIGALRATSPDRTRGVLRGAGLARLGYRTPRAEATPGSVDVAVEQLAVGLLKEGAPVRVTAQILGDVAVRAAPAGEAERIRAAAAVCPDRLLEELRAPHDLVLRAAAPRPLLLLAAAGFLTALAAPFGAAAVLALLIFVAGLSRARARRPDPDGIAVVEGFAPALLVGVLAGIAGGYLTHRIPPPVPVALVALFIGVVLAGLAVTAIWRTAIEDWGEACGLYAAVPVPALLDGVVSAALADDFAFLEARLRCTDVAAALAVQLDQLAHQMDAAAATLGVDAGRPLPAAPWLVRVAGEGGRELREEITEQVRAAVLELVRDRGDRTVEAAADGRMAAPLARALGLDGNTQVYRSQPITVARAARIAEVLDADNPEGLVRLADSRAQQLLSRTPTAQRWVRFAPAAAQPALNLAGGVDADDRVAWTSGHVAGVMQLIPLLPDVVHVHRDSGRWA